MSGWFSEYYQAEYESSEQAEQYEKIANVICLFLFFLVVWILLRVVKLFVGGGL